MIVPTMNNKEVAAHVQSEIAKNEQQIKRKALEVGKKMKKIGKTLYSYKQKVGSNTELTIYINGIDKKGMDYACGCWFHTNYGLCWVSVGAIGVNFYSQHFFEQYAKRFLKKQVDVYESALEFHRHYQMAAARKIKKRDDGKYELQFPIKGGLALGVDYDSNQIAFYNTCVTDEMLFADQKELVEADRELNEAIKGFDAIQFKAVVEALKK